MNKMLIIKFRMFICKEEWSLYLRNVHVYFLTALFFNLPHSGLSSTCPLSIRLDRLQWLSVQFMTLPTQTEMGHQTTWPFMCGYLFFWSFKLLSHSFHHIFLQCTALIHFFFLTFSVLSMVGLFLIALGTGGIKPCVAAFGGDQFSEHQVRLLTFSKYFLWLSLLLMFNLCRVVERVISASIVQVFYCM